MSVKSFFTSFFDSISDSTGLFKFREELFMSAVQDEYQNDIEGRVNFDGVVLKVNYPNPAEGNPDVGYGVRTIKVRPLELHNFIIPDPCSFSTRSIQEYVISLHPTAYSDGNTKERQKLAVGDVVECYYDIQGPQHEGNLRGLRFTSTVKSRRTGNYTWECLENLSGLTSEGSENLRRQRRNTGGGGTLGDTAGLIGNPNASNEETCRMIIPPTVSLAAYDSNPAPSREEDERYFKAVIAGLGGQPTADKLRFLLAWQAKENSSSNYNPFATSWPKIGSSIWSKDPNMTCYNWNKKRAAKNAADGKEANGCWVKNYSTFEAGVKGTVDTLLWGERKGLYVKIVAALKSPNQTFDDAWWDTVGKEFRTWGGGCKRTLPDGSANPDCTDEKYYKYRNGLKKLYQKGAKKKTPMETQLKRSGNVNRCKSLAVMSAPDITALAEYTPGALGGSTGGAGGGIGGIASDLINNTQMPEDNPEIEQNIPLNRSELA